MTEYIVDLYFNIHLLVGVSTRSTTNVEVLMLGLIGQQVWVGYSRDGEEGHGDEQYELYDDELYVFDGEGAGEGEHWAVDWDGTDDEGEIKNWNEML